LEIYDVTVPCMLNCLAFALEMSFTRTHLIIICICW